MSVADHLEEAAFTEADYATPRAPTNASEKRRLEVLPTKAEVVYQDPMKPPRAGKGRKCGNCPMLYPKLGRCSIHGPNLPVDSGDMCNFHIPGSPDTSVTKWPDMGDMEYAKPHLSGFTDAPSQGQMCDNCQHFRSKGEAGYCYVVSQRGLEYGPTYAGVHRFGRCSRWEKQ